MSQKKRSVILSNTVYSKLEVLVNTGEYSDIDDAATDLLMQVLRGTTPVPSQVLPKKSLNESVPQSTTPVLTSTHTESVVIPVETRLPETPIALVPESPLEELERLRALKPMDRMKHSDRITELKTLLEA